MTTNNQIEWIRTSCGEDPVPIAIKMPEQCPVCGESHGFNILFNTDGYYINDETLFTFLYECKNIECARPFAKQYILDELQTHQDANGKKRMVFGSHERK